MWLILDIYYLLQNALSQKILFAGIHHYNPRCTAAAALRGRGRLLLVSGLGHVDARCRHRLQHRQVWPSQLLGQRPGVDMAILGFHQYQYATTYPSQVDNNIIWYRSGWNLDKTRYWINLSTWIYLRLRVLTTNVAGIFQPGDDKCITNYNLHALSLQRNYDDILFSFSHIPNWSPVASMHF